jgi:hypothetical protein
MWRTYWELRYSSSAEQELEELFKQNTRMQEYWEGNSWFYRKNPKSSEKKNGIFYRISSPVDDRLPRLCVFYSIDDVAGVVTIRSVRPLPRQ